MPRILVVTDAPEETPATVVFRERIALTDLESDPLSGRLVERVGWAVLDADELEHGDDRRESGSAGWRRTLDELYRGASRLASIGKEGLPTVVPIGVAWPRARSPFPLAAAGLLADQARRRGSGLADPDD